MYCVLKIDHFGQQKYLTYAGTWTRQPTEAMQFQNWHCAAVAAERTGGDVVAACAHNLRESVKLVS